MNTNSQARAILSALQAGEAVTPLEALRRFNCFRLGARIKDLKDGKVNHTKYDIETVMVKLNGKRYASYKLMTPRLRIIQAIPAFPKAETNNQSLF
jgi:hypothetical protein